jgi:acyl-CoA dehydrogenase
MRTILEDSAAKTFTSFEEPSVLRRVEAGEWPAAIWDAISGQGLELIFAGGSDDPWRDAGVILKACGRQVVPAPLAETLVAGALISATGLDPVEGAVTLASPLSSRLTLANGRLSGTAPGVAWARQSGHVVAMAGEALVVVPVAAASLSADRSIGREPRDMLTFDEVRPVSSGAISSDTALAYGAMARAAQMAGAIEAVLAMTVQYARDRSQFGKPIGSFQAIQHQLAILAGHSAAASRVVDSAFDRVADGADAAFEAAVSKIRVGEAAGAAASIAHQVHGAIGFTDEHRLHYFTRRLWSWRTEFGSEALWSERLGKAVAEAGGDAYWPSITAAG